MLLEEIASIFATSELRNHWQRVAHTTRGTTSETRPALSHYPSGSFGPGGTPTSLDLFTFRFAPRGSFSNAGDAEISRPPVDSTQRSSFTANFTRSQRIDVDKRVTFRVVVVDACDFRGSKRLGAKEMAGLVRRRTLQARLPAKVCRRSEHRHNNTQFRRGSCLNFHFTTSPCCVAASRCCGRSTVGGTACRGASQP